MKRKIAKKAKPSRPNTIFIQIASYRDPQLKPTLVDMLDKADCPENLRVGIAWQHAQEDSWDNLDEYKKNPNIIEVVYKIFFPLISISSLIIIFILLPY